ncbi:adenosine receptor A1-like [Alosa sapidissima]|uniref:adenosine receptor A1-like n=1 Tax=Alosa sapidissima TaxID=34773 RepID=UPI001C09CBEF|nr:adenosine receptor A1-like [Alosa sapidissima]
MASKSELVYTVLEVLIGVACCLGNLLVIWALWKCGAVRRQPTFCFIASLAVADFLVGAVVVPMRILGDGRIHLSFHGCVAFCSVVIVLTQTSVFSQLAIAVDRFLRVAIPLRYKTTVTLSRCWWVVTACWLTAATVGFTPLMGWNNRTTMTQNRTQCQFLNVMSMSYLVYFSFYTLFLVPMLVMTVLYCSIFTLIHRQLRSTISVVSHSYYHKEQKLARSLVLVLVLFAICWLPIQLMNIITFYGTKSTIPRQVFYVGVLVSQINSALNPIIYALKIQRIRDAIKTRFILCKGEIEVSKSSQTPGHDHSSNPKRNTCDELKTIDTIDQD